MVVNLSVQDLARSVAFFTTLGFAFDPKATHDTAAFMSVNKQTGVMLHAGADSATPGTAFVTLSASSRKEVDQVGEKALAAGATAVGTPEDTGTTYARSFQDLDGHRWQVLWTNPDRDLTEDEQTALLALMIATIS